MRVLLLAGDIACFLAFAVLGLRNHDDGITAASLFRSAGPYVGAWIAVGLSTGLYRSPAAFAWRALLPAWVAAWAAGTLVRSLAFDRPLLTAFPLIALMVAGALLLGWRTAAGLGTARGDVPGARP